MSIRFFVEMIEVGIRHAIGISAIVLVVILMIVSRVALIVLEMVAISINFLFWPLSVVFWCADRGKPFPYPTDVMRFYREL